MKTVTQRKPKQMNLLDWKKKLIGQEHVIDSLIPYYNRYQAGLAPEDKPSGCFMLTGSTGSGKTHTVETLAELLHGSRKNVLRIDCGEFQLDHEVAKLIGAPPGYLGHRETAPMLTQAKLNAITSERCSLSIVLFDEIEKAAPSLHRLVLGLMDRGSLKLGDSNTVNFERSFVFFTSNCGAREFSQAQNNPYSFVQNHGLTTKQNDTIFVEALRKKFSPEFINRLDETIVFNQLTTDDYRKIIDLEIAKLCEHIRSRSTNYAYVTDAVKEHIFNQCRITEYGAREIKRIINKLLLNPFTNAIVERSTERLSGIRLPYSSFVADMVDGEVVITCESDEKKRKVSAVS